MKGTDYSAIPANIYSQMQPWTIELTLCPCDGTWLADLEAFERDGPPPLDFASDWTWVSLNGGPRIPVLDQRQRVLLRVVAEAEERIPAKTIRRQAVERYGCDLPEKLAAVVAALPEELRHLIDRSNAGYLFVGRSIPAGSK